jgi:hypothetical protein
MRIYISYSLSPIDIHVASLLSQQASERGHIVDMSTHENTRITSVAQAIYQRIKVANMVIAIVSADSTYQPYVYDELNMAVELHKPVLALIERGVGNKISSPNIQYVEFDRYNLGPALVRISTMLERKQNQQNTGAWLLAGGLAILALYLLSNKDK